MAVDKFAVSPDTGSVGASEVLQNDAKIQKMCYFATFCAPHECGG